MKAPVRPTGVDEDFAYHERVTDWLRRGVHPAIAAIEAHYDPFIREHTAAMSVLAPRERDAAGRFCKAPAEQNRKPRYIGPL